MSKGISLKQTMLGDSTMTSCAKAMKLMQSLMDGELAGPDLQRVITHLEACVDCGMKYETYQAIKASAGRIGRVELDETTVEELTEFARNLSKN